MFGFGKKKKGFSEQPVKAETMRLIKKCAADVERLIGIDSRNADARTVVEAINTYASKWQKGERPTDLEDSQYTLGALWGEQLVATFGWEWTSVTFHEHGDSEAIGVVSPNRSLAVYPFHFLLGCLQDSGVPVTILLAFNMVAEGKIPQMPAHGYQNLMDGVHHIVPPA
jgi:hypothetical protein